MLRTSRCFLCASSSTVFERIFVINLDRRTDRWHRVQAELQKVRGLHPHHTIERISAVEGRAYTETSAVHALEAAGLLSHLGARRLLAPAADRVWGMDLTPGAVGCALSHVQLWTRIAALGSAQHATHALRGRLPPSSRSEDGPSPPVFLIVEDDSCFSADFLDIYRQLTVPSDWQLLYVGGLDTAGECPRLRVPSAASTRTHVCRVPRFHRTTHAYALTPSGARALLRRCLPLTYQIDTMMTMHAAPPDPRTASAQSDSTAYVQDPCCYTLQPPLVTQRSETDSDIQTLS